MLYPPVCKSWRREMRVNHLWMCAIAGNAAEESESSDTAAQTIVTPPLPPPVVDGPSRKDRERVDNIVRTVSRRAIHPAQRRCVG